MRSVQSACVESTPNQRKGTSMPVPVLDQMNLVVRDMEATLAFYRALGLEIPEEEVWRTASGAHHATARIPGGVDLEFDSPALAKIYNQGWRDPGEVSSRAVITFRIASREEVDRLYERLTGLGYAAAQPPYDTFWGARYAIVEDPDANHVGLMSVSDPARRSAPPDI